ncbi:aspartate/glutamate racemase family protein [Defluviimonas sp. WL0002]|uniref:Aspartate/glutamate racemase family protein n=1 Tax=Albidovulum marisflavi TaxID=2984159 RepID=A0ABT2ZBA9_9RHOB|nr:aspartate/glutamate racemase family protein [Defluviimonas sp. WL0002]MCV2868430.1 aspartate/glutamate racemase family protein [Defluviimonas sp. WL0002]
MKTVGFDLVGPIGAKATLGLIVLQADETLEQDFRRLFPDRDVALYVSRIPSGEELSTDSIAAMEAELPRGARLLPRAARFDALGYGCTSGTTLIGAEAVARMVRRGVETPVVTDPLTAALAALAALGVKHIGLVTPYVENIAAPVRDAFEAAGFPVAAAVTFGEEAEARVARIAPESIRAAAREVAGSEGVEALFLSCTNLRTLDVIDDLESELGIPVLSSNQVLAWHMARSTGATLAKDAPGRLLQTL